MDEKMKDMEDGGMDMESMMEDMDTIMAACESMKAKMEGMMGGGKKVASKMSNKELEKGMY